MALGKWIHNRETLMQSVFSIEDVRTAFPTLSPQVVRNGLSRMAKAGKILSVHRGVYVILPAKYERRGTVPPSFYMDSLMKRLGRSYYFGLLSAARYWGASHQLPMAETVVTTRPDMSASAHRNPLVKWLYRSAIPERFVVEAKGEYDRVKYSTSELTALDLVQFAQSAGGLSRVASVLCELVEKLDFAGTADSGLFSMTTIPTIQRLGHVLEYTVEAANCANALYEELLKFSRKSLKTVLLAPGSKPLDMDRRNIGRWHVLANFEIEIDEL